MKRKTLWLAAGAVIIGALAGLSFLRTTQGASSWTELGSVAGLKEQFNRDHGVARIVLLLSPT